MPASLLYRSYAKVNLYLEVLNRRPDGYHDIETIFQTVGLYDELTFSERTSGVSVDCTGHELDAGDTNLAYLAAMALREHIGEPRGVHIQLHKHIPIAAGMAGGSGNAAATLTALNLLWDCGLDTAMLETIALELGSDVPYCLHGGTMTASGRGERLAPLYGLPETWFVLVHPRLEVSAGRVYNSGALRMAGAAPDGEPSSGLQEALDALRQSDWARLVRNRLEEPVFADFPQLAAIKENLVKAGALVAAMSGSGPTLFGVCETKRHAEEVASRLEGGLKTTIAPRVHQGVERVA
jgi:4-diphosphocytidyl-2-C-methyl-D-erythritol kinase